METSDLTLEEQFAWDQCDCEHGFEQTVDRTCSNCDCMISGLETFLKKALKREVGKTDIEAEQALREFEKSVILPAGLPLRDDSPLRQDIARYWDGKSV